MAPFFAVSMDYIAQTFKEKSAHGISLSFAVGAMLIVTMHYLVGVFTEHYGIKMGLTLGPIFLLLAFLLFLFEKKFFSSEHSETS